MFHELVPLLEAAIVQQQLKALACGEFPFQVLLMDAVLTAAEFRRRLLGAQLFDDFLHLHSHVQGGFSPVLAGAGG